MKVPKNDSYASPLFDVSCPLYGGWRNPILHLKGLVDMRCLPLAGLLACSASQGGYRAEAEVNGACYIAAGTQEENIALEPFSRCPRQE
jgi:hypothetical protein